MFDLPWCAGIGYEQEEFKVARRQQYFKFAIALPKCGQNLNLDSDAGVNLIFI